jgi:hypothetical protein
MARAYLVKRAQARYETKPVIDPATGEQKQTPKMRRGVQMTDKRGRPIFMKVTERDLARPKPMPCCSLCRTEIKVGESYTYTETYNSTIVRCGRPCPPPKQWEYSSSLSARLAQIQHENDFSDCEDGNDFVEARDAFAAAVRELAGEKQESAQNIEDGFGHETSQSAELADIADQLEGWADDIEAVELPDYPEPEETDCDECNGTGEADDEGGGSCENCDGCGQVIPDEPTEEQIDEWREACVAALEGVAESCPV